jgi:hypothetical protein
MRDVATRQQELLFATRLTPRDYLLGRWGGALVVMLVVYAAIPIGLVAGTLMPWVESTSLLPFDLQGYARPLLVLVLPNVLVVSALFFTAGALGRSFMTILLLGVGLVALWSSGVALARDGVVAGALVDPFGNAALEWATREWSAADRAGRLLPWDGWILANRGVWLAVGAAALATLARRYRFEVASGDGTRGAGTRAAPVPDFRELGVRAAATSDVTTARDRAPWSRPRPSNHWQQLAREARWTFRWTLRERGFITLALLGALNALANAWRAGGSSPTAGDVLGTVQEHARIFLILVATIYAGELVWRERDVRTDAMRDVLPVGTGSLVAGKIGGILLAQAVLVLPLLLVALVVGYFRGAAGMSFGLATAWIGGIVYPFLAQLTLLSLLVHAVVQQKVAGHVLLIVGWVLAVAMARTLDVPLWLRYANLPPFTWTPADGFCGSGATLAWGGVYWSAIAAVAGVLASLGWVRGVHHSPTERLRAAAVRSTRTPALLLAASIVVALVAWRSMRA